MRFPVQVSLSSTCYRSGLSELPRRRSIFGFHSSHLGHSFSSKTSLQPFWFLSDIDLPDTNEIEYPQAAVVVGWVTCDFV
jgi:hypothetical protein